ncbi:MAG: hypothetical protein IKU12_02855 [Oscillospiraceae bacterium]|nr:hypothetical protein [Oscillospiraceae bacterium]
MNIPVYMIAGFLDSGKTNFINGILADGFAMEDRTLLLCCEEGEEEYDPKVLRNVTVINVEDQEELTPAYLKKLEKQYKPQQVIIESNGMWLMEEIYSKSLPANWILYQIMTLVDSRSFEVYAKNMGQLMMEKIINADMVIFNRCNEELRRQLRSRNLRMVNRRADMFFENDDGTSEDYADDSIAPFDMDADVIAIPDDDFGVWYVDVMDHPERYAGKSVSLKMLMCHSKKYKGVHCPGRFAMICCEKDITFLGVVCKGDTLKNFVNREWVEIQAKVAVEHHAAYKGDGPVLYVESIAPCVKPEEEVVSF